MKYQLIIPGRLPGLNEYISLERTNKHIAAKEKRKVENDIILLCRVQLKNVKIDKPVHIWYNWVEKDKRRDKDNISFAKKFVQDALVKCGVLKNDGWNNIIGFSDTFEVDVNNPRVEIIIEEIER